MDIVSWPFAVFVALTLAVYYFLPHRLQNLWLLLASYVFYGTFAWQFPLILLVLSVSNFLIALKLKDGPKPILWIGVGFNVVVLAIFKFANLDPGLTGALQILFPIGLSFLVLQNISYLVDVQRGQLDASSNFVEFALYLAYFPKLISGPIERARAFLPALANVRRVNEEWLSKGFTLIVTGLFRKVVIADQIKAQLPTGFFGDPLKFPVGFLGAAHFLIIYGFFLYNDFAGYTNIVCGVSSLFGIELSPNFRWPFFARNFTEFWNRWHMSLSSWLRDYIYFPMSRALLRRNNNPRFLPNIIVPPLVTMVLSGLWHGATANTLVWGATYGVYLIGERLIALSRRTVSLDALPRWRQVTSAVVIFILVTLAWMPFFLSLDVVWKYIQVLAMPSRGAAGIRWAALILVLVSVALDWIQYRAQDELVFLRWPLVGRAAILAVAVLAIALASVRSTAEFVYQGF